VEDCGSTQTLTNKCRTGGKKVDPGSAQHYAIAVKRAPAKEGLTFERVRERAKVLDTFEILNVGRANAKRAKSKKADAKLVKGTDAKN